MYGANPSIFGLSDLTIIKTTGGALNVGTDAAGSIASPITSKLSIFGYSNVERATISAVDQASNTAASFLTFSVRNTADVLGERMRIDGTGNVLINGFTASTIGLTVKGAASQTANLQEWQDSAGTILSRIKSTGVLNLPAYTVATLPAGVQGDRCYVTNALAPVFLTALVGGGAVKCPAFYDGANWVAG
jgi:hypothetical protein